MIRIFALCIALFALGPAPGTAQGLARGLLHRAQAMWSDMDKQALVWGSLISPSSVHPSESDNWKFEVYAKPELKLWQPHEDLRLTAYALISGHRDGARDTWNNKLRGGIGLELKYQLSPAVRVSAGVRWDNEYQYLQKTYLTGTVLTGDVSIWKTWDLHHVGLPLLQRSRIVLSGWSNLRYPASLAATERDNVLVQGSVKLALDVPLFETRLRLSPYISVTAKTDKARRDWNNSFEPALGLALKIPLGKGGELALGAKAAHQRRFRSKTSFSGTQIIAGFYKNF